VTPIDALVMVIVWFPAWGGALALWLAYRASRATARRIHRLRAHRRTVTAFLQAINDGIEDELRGGRNLPIADTTRGTDDQLLTECRRIAAQHYTHRDTGPRPGKDA
jgi:hypothetical protein